MRNIAQTFTLRIAVLTICTSLLMPGVSLPVSEAAQGQAGALPVRARSNRPEGMFPDLDEIKNESSLKREPPAPIPSTIRSKRNQGKPWDGRRVGEPFTPGRLDQPVANGAQRNHRQSLKGNFIRRAHARGRFNPPQTLSDSQFIQNFFNVALVRTATSEETFYWSYQLRAGYGVAPTSLKLAAIELGRTLFESASYAARNRDAHWYVYDLYKTYLMRDPDAGGWAMWEGLVSSHGREYVRRGFEESGEFATLVGNIVPNGAGSPSASSLISAMADPSNQPGNGMLTRDASWNVPLLSLPGRNGLDLGLTLSYSSMVWTRSGPYFYFDQDNGFPSPGFRLGFPTVQRKVFDAQTSRNSYLLLTPAGRRVQLRQVNSSTVYEAADSSYLQLSENVGNLLVRSTDGTQLTFVEANNEYRCTQIKDRNGNYITVNYNALGHITTITDTLGRIIVFNYDSNANLLSITQSWAGQPSHQWVSFGWGTRNMQHSFSNDAVIGTANGTVVPVITQVALNDTSYFTFDYTNSLQVSAVKNYFGALERNANTFTYQTVSGDVPRLSSSSVSARNWSGYNNVPAQVTTQYSVDGDGACVLTAPDGTIYKEYYGTGWQKGLTVLSEVWSGGAKQKWTTTLWTQDTPSLTYPLNPRVAEINVYDAGNNRRRTTIHYDNSQYAQYGLPTEVREYAADAGTVIRKTVTDYNLNQVYLNQRIIGLISQVQLANGSEYLSKTTYAYDDPARLAALPVAPTRHDTSYSTSFTARGNVTSASRWDVTDINNAAKKLTSYTNYYTTGSPSSATDPAGHQQSISYADAFSDSVNRNTFAYPTTLTDADNFSSFLQYNFDFGATTRTQSPAPAGQTQGAIQTMTYNGLGQLERITTTNNLAYKRFWYGADFTASYTSVNSVNDEAYAVQVTDGMGRVIGALNNHPGSTGGFSLVHRVYDRMGRVWLQSNPTEVNSAWVTTGDDAAGISYTQQTYDWKGRPLVTTHPDLTTKFASYSGCGCAGGEVVTLTDEGTINGGAAKRRQQKIYSDVLGRSAKTEILNWQGGSPYSTTVNTYNARDQVTQVRQYTGVEGSSIYQDTTLSYDGYGRLKTQHRPEQQADTTFNYNADDTISYVIDARAARTDFSYNSRHLLTGITYDVSSNIYVTPVVAQSFAYDAAGNRTSMTDGTGTTTYQYNSLSQLSSETRNFAGPFSTTPYTLSYAYNLIGEMTSLVLPSQFGTALTYTHDAVGRLTSLTGSGYSYTNNSNAQVPVTSFLSNAVYRAWNDLKQMNTGSSSQTSFTYNSNLRPTSYKLTAGSTSYTWNYQYYADGSTRMVSDAADDHFDKAYAYDHVGRMTEAYSGREARGLPVSTPTPDSPFRQSFTYNAFNEQVSETGRIWQREIVGQMFSFTNNRRSDLMYDAAGHVIADAQGSHVFDAAGHRVLATAGTVGGGETGHPEMAAEERAVTYDGQGQPAKNTLITRSEILVGGGPQTFISNQTEITYYLRSTVLGGYVVGELNNLGQKSKQYIYAGGERLLEHWTASNFPSINWQHRNPLTDSWIAVDPNGLASFRSEVDAHGRETGIEAPIILNTDPPPPPTRDPSYLEMHGAPTIEAALGMQLYEDVYINRIFEDGNGPGQGGYDRLRTIREFQLSVGGKFAVGMSWFDVLNDRQNYESVMDYVKPGWESRESGRQINYYRLKPGTRQKRKTGPSEKEEPQDPQSRHEITTCQKFYLRVQQIADGAKSVKGFLDEFARTFTSAQSSDLLDMIAANTPTRTNHPSNQFNLNDGIRSEFRGPADHRGQIRHFTAAFIASAGYGMTAENFMNDREDANDPDGQTDLAVNRLAFDIKRNLESQWSVGVDLARIQRDFAKYIRERFCTG
jgi:YD repeat-containing protein